MTSADRAGEAASPRTGSSARAVRVERTAPLQSARRGRRPAAAELQGATEMRQALDAIAVEVERISENQRYVTKLLSERLGEGAAKGIETHAKERVDAR